MQRRGIVPALIVGVSGYVSWNRDDMAPRVLVVVNRSSSTCTKDLRSIEVRLPRRRELYAIPTLDLAERIYEHG